MQQSKNLAIAFLLGAVLVGGALGFTADRVLLRDRISPPESGHVSLADRLQLDAAQRAKLDSIADDRRKRYDVIMSAVRPALDSSKQRARDEIRLMLTPTQRAEFEKVLACRNRFGLLAEDIDVGTRELWGNFPQTDSMVGIIMCAKRLSRQWDDAI